MKYKSFSLELWQKLDTAIQKISDLGTPAYAAFDADGTLWDTDLGEGFFKYQIQNNLLPQVFSKLSTDPWRHYRDWKESGDPRPAYLWLAQINAGISISQVRQWSQNHVDSIAPLPIFEDQKKLIHLLHQAKIQVFVITASIKWAVEPGAALLGIPPERVLGVETEIQNGLVTQNPAGHMTYKEGKLEALLNLTRGTPPFLAVGNTLGDQHLLASASLIPLAVGATNSDHELFAAEEKLRQLAVQKRWLVHHF